MEKFIKNKSEGYTLLFSVFTAVLVLGVAVFILSVSKKQYALAVAARESTYAIYAADSGIECASAAGVASSTSPTPSISCDGTNKVITAFAPLGSGDILSKFSPDYPVWQSLDTVLRLENGTCSKITITVGYNSNKSEKTIIDSSGYNVCTTSGNVTNPDYSNARIVERAFRLTIQ
jgi:hypothetical protein